MSERDLSRSELLAGLGLTNETRNARRHLDPLLEAGLIEWTVPDRPTAASSATGSPTPAAPA